MSESTAENSTGLVNPLLGGVVERGVVREESASVDEFWASATEVERRTTNTNTHNRKQRTREEGLRNVLQYKAEVRSVRGYTVFVQVLKYEMACTKHTYVISSGFLNHFKSSLKYWSYVMN